MIELIFSPSLLLSMLIESEVVSSSSISTSSTANLLLSWFDPALSSHLQDELLSRPTTPGDDRVISASLLRRVDHATFLLQQHGEDQEVRASFCIVSFCSRGS